VIRAFRKVSAFICLLTILSGCAGLPGRLPLPEAESAAVRESFKEMVGRQRVCKPSADAELTVTIDSRFFDGTMSGYLQTMAPSFVKLVGINPFGQPLVVLVSDGGRFSYAELQRNLVYDGSVDSHAFRRFVPVGFDPTTVFFALTGKVAPGEVRLLVAGRDRGEQGVWLDIEHSLGNAHSLVLFDPERQLISRYRGLDENGETAFEIAYDDFTAGSCRLPGLITVTSHDHAGEIAIRLTDWRTGIPSSAADFELELPAGFKRVKVN